MDHCRLATLALAVPLLKESFQSMAMLGGTLVLARVYVAQHKRRA